MDVAPASEMKLWVDPVSSRARRVVVPTWKRTYIVSLVCTPAMAWRKMRVSSSALESLALSSSSSSPISTRAGTPYYAHDRTFHSS